MESTTKSISSKIRVASAGIAFGVIASVLSAGAAVAVPKDCFNSPLCNDAPVFEDPTPPPPPPPKPCKITARCPVYDPADQVFDPGTGDPDPQPEPEPEPEPEEPEEEPEENDQDGPEQDGPEEDEPKQDRPDQTQPGGSAGTPSRDNPSSGSTSGGEPVEVAAEADEETSTETIEDLQQAAAAGDESGFSSQVWTVLAIATAVAALAAVAFIRRRRQIG